MLERLAGHAGLDSADVAELVDASVGTHEDEIGALVAEIYSDFVGWDEAARREKLAALARFGRESTLPLLRVLESYRAPDGAGNAIALKMLVVEQLGGLDDDRAVYYLAQQVNIGDLDDEITNAELRYAAAEALGRIISEGFSRDQAGVATARAWWLGVGLTRYDRLAL